MGYCDTFRISNSMISALESSRGAVADDLFGQLPVSSFQEHQIFFFAGNENEHALDRPLGQCSMLRHGGRKVE